MRSRRTVVPHRTKERASERPPRTGGDSSAASPIRSEGQKATRDALVEAAGVVMAEKGYGGSSIDEIAEAAGVTKATFYYHFDSKEALYAALVIPTNQRFADKIANIARTEISPDAILVRIADATIDYILEPSIRYSFYQEFVPVSEETKSKIAAIEKRIRDCIAGVLRLGQGAGTVANYDPDLQALIFLGCISRCARWYDAGGRIPADQFREALLRFILRGLLSSDAVKDAPHGAKEVNSA